VAGFAGEMFSLTPALSHWAREKRSQRQGRFASEFRSKTLEFYGSAERLFPSPGGRGIKGEGENTVRHNTTTV